MECSGKGDSESSTSPSVPRLQTAPSSKPRKARWTGGVQGLPAQMLPI